MSAQENLSVLQRKVNAPATQPEPFGMSPAKALRQAVARAAEEVAGMEASVSGFVQENTTVEQIVDRLKEPHLIYLTEGPDGAIGLALLNAQAMAAVIEQLTTGRVVPSQADPRTATRTDAVIVATILDRILEIFDEGLAQVTDAPPVAGYRQSVSLEDGRAITMALEDMPYRLYRLALDFGRGAKSGELSLIFPRDPTGQSAISSSAQAQWRANWRHAVMQSEVMVKAVLHRFTIPLDELGSLEVGTFVPMPLASVDRVSLEGSDRRCVATGKLGQCGGHRAIRVAAGSATEQPATSEMSAQDFATSDDPPAASLESETVPMDTGEAPPPGALGSDDANSDPSGDAAMPQMGTAV